MITIKRDAAIGDILMVMPLVQALRKRYQEIESVRLKVTPALYDRMHALLNSPVLQIVRESAGDEIDLNGAYEMRPHLHPVEAYCDVAGVDIADTTPAFCNTDINQSERFDVMIHATVSWRNRTLPRKFWEALVSTLHAKGLTVACIAQNRGEVIEGCDAVYLAQTLPRVAGLIGYRAGVFIGGDSGPLHLAAATNTPIIGLFTIALAAMRRPWGRDPELFVGIDAPVDCVGCIHRATAPVSFLECPAGADYACTKAFDTEAISEIAMKLLEKNKFARFNEN